jgi:DNA-binding NarL/FixJ family response regulator
VTDRSETAHAGQHSRKHPGTLTVLLLDDHTVMLEALRALIESDDTLVVIATASRVPDAIRLARGMQPDVAVMDVHMPDGGGWAAARGLREVCPDIRLVAFSSFDDALVTRTIAAAGISAFVTKGSEISVLLAAIRGEDVMPTHPQPMPLIRRTIAAGAE